MSKGFLGSDLKKKTAAAKAAPSSELSAAVQHMASSGSVESGTARGRRRIIRQYKIEEEAGFIAPFEGAGSLSAEALPATTPPQLSDIKYNDILAEDGYIKMLRSETDPQLRQRNALLLFMERTLEFQFTMNPPSATPF